MSVREGERVVWKLELGRLRALPIRAWIAVVSMKPWLWGLMVGLPSLLALAAYPVIGETAVLAFVWLAFIYFLMIWFTSRGTAATRYMLDHRSERVGVELPNVELERSAVAAALAGDDLGMKLAEVERFRPYPVPGHVVIDAVYGGSNYGDADSMVVPNAEYDRVRAGLARHCFDLPPRDELFGAGYRRTRWIRHAMALATFAIVLGIPLSLPLVTDIDPSLYGGALLMLTGLSAIFAVERLDLVPDGTDMAARLKRRAVRLIAGAVGVGIGIGVVIAVGQFTP